MILQKSLTWCFLSLFSFILISCEHIDEEYFSINENPAYPWLNSYYHAEPSDTFLIVYNSEDGFYENLKSSKSISHKHVVCPFYDHGNYKGRFNAKQEVKLWIDARSSDGYSTWTVPQTNRTGNYCSLKYLGYSGGDPLSGGIPGNKQMAYQVLLVFSSPPAHLHLCLDSLKENVYNEIPSKTWKITDISDLNGESLADDPDWWYYTDNRMKFEKTTKYTFWPGKDRSTEEIALFGSLKEHEVIFGSYSVTEDDYKDVTLTISFPYFQQDLIVVSSSWTEVILKGTRNNKTGILTMIPTKE